MKYSSILNLIGNTPLVELKNIKEKYNLKSKIYAKVESYNPFGSVKDRVAYQMIYDAKEKGLLKVGSTIIEPTSGNTGIALSAIGNILGYKVIIVMPNNMSIERIDLIEYYGAKVVLVDSSKGMKGCIDKAKELNDTIENSIILDQFNNKSNVLAHYLNTGKEIYNDLNEVDIFVAGIGTGGTITGVSKYLKEKNPNIYVAGVEPKSSPLLSANKSGAHKIQGIGANFIPGILDREIYNEIITVSDFDAFKYAKEVRLTEGIAVGISSGASLKAAIELAKIYENKNIVVIFPDSIDRYYSVGLLKEVE